MTRPNLFEHVQTLIAKVYYLNLGEAVKRNEIDNATDPDAIVQIEDRIYNTTIATVILTNGLVVVGKSQCFYNEDFNQQIGESAALENALVEIFSIAAFDLQTQIQNELHVEITPTDDELPALKQHKESIDRGLQNGNNIYPAMVGRADEYKETYRMTPIPGFGNSIVNDAYRFDDVLALPDTTSNDDALKETQEPLRGRTSEKAWVDEAPFADESKVKVDVLRVVVVPETDSGAGYVKAQDDTPSSSHHYHSSSSDTSTDTSSTDTSSSSSSFD